MVTPRFWFLEMCLAWRKAPSEIEALPREDQRELWAHWKWRNERRRMLEERAEMERKARAR